MKTYTGTRAAAAEITTALITVGAGAVAVKQTTPGVMTLGPALAAALAHQAAVASFPLGAGLGSLWYGVFPAAVSPALIGGVTGGLLAVSSVAAAFAGILADPVQRRLGLHQRRLLRLIDALERQWETEREGLALWPVIPTWHVSLISSTCLAAPTGSRKPDVLRDRPVPGLLGPVGPCRGRSAEQVQPWPAER